MMINISLFLPRFFSHDIVDLESHMYLMKAPFWLPLLVIPTSKDDHHIITYTYIIYNHHVSIIKWSDMPNCPTQSCLILKVAAAPTYEIEKLLLVVGLQLVDKLYTSLRKSRSVDDKNQH